MSFKPRRVALLVASLTALGLAQNANAAPSPTTAQVVVKVGPGTSIDALTADLRLEVDSPVLASRGIYLVHSTDARYADFGRDPARRAKELAHRADALAHKIQTRKDVVYAEPNLATQLSDTRFHSWPYGLPDAVGVDAAAWLGQHAATTLRLDAAHAVSRGAGTIVAVLDTGVERTHPAVAGHVLPGWNYVDDNADTDDVAAGLDADVDGVADSAVGHGTFVSGLVALVAPDARILPQRVLNSDGTGSIFAVAEAIRDAVTGGADIINLSLGTAQASESNLLRDAIKAAAESGVLVVAAAGNDGSRDRQYPACEDKVIGVGALARDNTTLTAFSSRGAFIDVAAPGEAIVGPIPGGGYARWAGTSAAAPIAAGQAALLRSQTPRLRPDKVTEAIRKTAQTLTTRDAHFGAIDIVASLNYRSGRK